MRKHQKYTLPHGKLSALISQLASPPSIPAMPVFSKPQNLLISNSQFMDNSTTNMLSGPTGIDILLEASCPEAAHDAADREYSPRCFPGTREQHIEDIINWAIPAFCATTTPIYWMKGPAGVGKSAIAQTCAEELKNRAKLGAAFFFSINGRDKPEKFFPSVAYQLSTVHPPYRDLIDAKIRYDKTLVKKSMSFQFRYLIGEPLRELGAQGKGIGKRIVVIIDGLDECEGIDAQCEIIRIIASAASDATLPLCWAFFSRPEPHIEATFAGTTVSPHCYKVTLPISRDTAGEIELYLRDGFENILKHRNVPMESQWPSAEDMAILVGAAGGSFIYATTVVRFVDHLGSLGHQKRLHEIIDIILNLHGSPSTGAPFAGLDAFYTIILQRIPTEILTSVHLLLAMICQWGSLSVILGANILVLSKDDFKIACNYASAVVHLQDLGKELVLDPTIDTRSPYTQIKRDALVKLDYSVRHEIGGRVSFYHRSFQDFLLDPARSGRYCVKGSEALTRHYLKTHVDYDRSYFWKGSELVLAPGLTDSATSLSYPYTNELVNSLIKARVYIEFGSEDPQSFSLSKFGRLDTDRDVRKYLHVFTHLQSRVRLSSRSALLGGCKCRVKFYPGTWICWSALAGFNINEFRLMVKERKQSTTFQSYHPKWSSRIMSPFHSKNRERFESETYRMGHGEKSIFWYWEVNYELGHFKSFATIDLAEGKKRFREENFASWPEWGTYLYE